MSYQCDELYLAEKTHYTRIFDKSDKSDPTSASNQTQAERKLGLNLSSTSTITSTHYGCDIKAAQYCCYFRGRDKQNENWTTTTTTQSTCVERPQPKFDLINTIYGEPSSFSFLLPLLTPFLLPLQATRTKANN